MTIDFKFIGWNNTDGHDKVWVSFVAECNEYVAWGRRGTKLQFKNHGRTGTAYGSIVDKLIRQKGNKGYKKVNELQLFAIFPDFEDKVVEELTIGLLSGKIR